MRQSDYAKRVKLILIDSDFPKTFIHIIEIVEVGVRVSFRSSNSCGIATRLANLLLLFGLLTSFSYFLAARIFSNCSMNIYHYITIFRKLLCLL
jgi:hypothetical protein